MLNTSQRYRFSKLLRQSATGISNIHAVRWNGTGATSAAKASRTARRAKIADAKNKGIVTPFRLGVGITLGVTGFIVFDIRTHKEGALGSMYYGSPLESLVSWIYSETWGRFQEIYYPSDDKLLPDWPTAPVSPVSIVT
jgi:hypothetical protein